MTTALEVDVAERDGRPVVRKRATDDAGVERLDREARRLREARHPGVVSVLEHERGVLILAWAGDRSLDTYRPPVEVAAAVLVAIAETVADLHDLGVVHGRLSPDHVVVDAHGRPRLCGMAGADPHAEQPTAAADDVAALGHLIELLVGPGAEAEPIPDRRWVRRRWTGYRRRSLQNLADQATDPDPTHRPTARTLAASLAAVVPEARLAPSSAPEGELVVGEWKGVTGSEDDDGFAEVDRFLGMRVTDDAHLAPLPSSDAPRAGARRSRPSGHGAPVETQRRHRPRRPATALAVVAVVLVAVALLGTRPPSRAAEQTLSSHPSTTAVASTSAAIHPEAAHADASRPRPSPPGRADCPPVASPSADVDGDRCPDPIVVTGSTIQAGPVRYRLGEDGDDVAVGDWDCDGQATPALVRPGTGEVFVFSRWATAAEPLSIGSTAAVPVGAVPLPATDCGPLQVRTPSGAITTVTMATP